MEPIMQGEDHQTPRMPVLARLDRLDRLLQFLEERQNPSYAHNSCSSPSNKEVGKQCQPLSSELEEVRFKGTLIECVAMLENRILQLSLDMEEGSTSSSSTIPTSGKLRNLFTEQDNGDVMDSYQEENHDKVKDKSSEEIQTSKPPYFKKKSKRRTNQLLIRSRKLLGWFPMGC